MGVILPKIQREMPAVGSTSHCRMQGTKHSLEHLMRHRGLRSIRNSYGTSEALFSCVEIRKTIGFNSPKSKLHFSPQIGGENQNFEGLL